MPSPEQLIKEAMALIKATPDPLTTSRAPASRVRVPRSQYSVVTHFQRMHENPDGSFIEITGVHTTTFPNTPQGKREAHAYAKAHHGKVRAPRATKPDPRNKKHGGKGR
jgi:hypothetical protein